MHQENDDRRLRILHVILVLRSTNSQYNEHSLPVMHDRDITLCTYFPPQLTPPSQITVFAGDGTIRGFFRALRRALAAAEYDVIHVHSPHTGVLTVMAIVGQLRLGLRRRLVYTVHNCFDNYRTRNKLLLIPVLAVFFRVVFCSNAAYESLPGALRRLVGRRARVVQNGADLDRIDRVVQSFDPSVGDGFTVLSVGRLDDIKDPMLVLDAFAEAVGERSSLVFVGDGRLRVSLERAIAARGLDDRVTLTGLIEREDVFRHFVEADVFVSASHGEGLPLAAMEAMACSLPVILSDIPPHREFGEQGSVIPLVPPGDMKGFAQELVRLQAMAPDERKAVGLACREVVEKGFSLARMTAGYESIYREVSSSGGSP